MPTRATTSDLLSRVHRRVTRDVNEAAGENALVSKTEQKTLPDALLRESAERLRMENGAYSRVHVDELIGWADTRIADILGHVNQRSGPGAAVVSKAEIEAVYKRDLDAGARVARAYELITGRRIDPPTTTTTTTTATATSELTSERIALITAYARDAARSGDMMTGDVQLGPGREITFPIDVPGSTRRHTVHIAVQDGQDPNSIELIWLRSQEPGGIVRYTTFGVPIA